MAIVYVLKQRAFSRYLNQNGATIECFRCGKELKTGEKIVVKRKRDGSLSKCYHQTCYKSLYIEA